MCVVFVAAPPPKTLTKEWQEASNERAKELNLNPITGMYSTSLYNLQYALSSDIIYASFFFSFLRYIIRRLLRQRFRSSKEVELVRPHFQIVNYQGDQVVGGSIQRMREF